MKLHSFFIVRQSKDFYSAVIRFSLGLFIALYVWLGMSSGEFTLTQSEYNAFAFFFFSMTTIFGLDLFRNPNSHIRRYSTLFFDFSCTTYAITLTVGGNSEFILIYIWLYIAYGTRYGSNYLFTALALVLIQYNAVLIVTDTWAANLLGSSAQLFVLITMPLYLHSMLKQLREAKQAAELATRAKSNFLATMSHEIRTPMSGIIGTTHLLQKTEQTKEQKEYTEALLDASKSLHALIDDILDFSKIEANKLHLQQTSFDLRHTINEVVSVLSPNAEYHSLDLITYVDPELPSFVIGDSQRIRQILFNLLGNAIKFTEQGEIILKVTGAFISADKPSHASLKQSNINLCFDIIDTGIGINNEQQKLIFNSFTQANNLQTDKFGGTGLGTTISKQLVEFMGGEIGLSSVLGAGSHFWFTLSLPVEKIGDIKERYHHQLANKRIAVSVCKNALYETLENYCHFFGFTVERFYSESELLNGLQQAIKHKQPFDLVMLSSSRDKNMPLKLVNKINALDFAPYVAPKKVFLNYLSKRAETQKLGASLFDSYISKPVNFERLADELLALLKPDNIQMQTNKYSDLSNISLNILIAEDEDINAMVLTSFLQDAGHKTKRVLNGAQAVEELSQNTYDIAFMDMRMPEMNGIEATISWRDREPEGAHIPIIALTANATKDDRKSCMDAGMDDFITKPITPEQLSSAILKFYSPRV
ncbi:MAG: response regulator [gamma proteobacterium symbiont of Bathyaustriella thionipta]|nr:response regulator [gamma proteobacterium symbiont of Bathyaustriella thionipta]MCU7951984.1 response regulator [gamma proteobacterium symbiont of Bathyaustriella thionipta]MCU7956375.1 response regulator [gamma proteobacterium symbiont of Bathyaustriella thionipta]MCU7968710.1 response regulator [gamma proteobacterium symbiont of Bathyaustriella thionipta]